MSALLAHGGTAGLIGEIGIPLLILTAFGFYLWRSSKKEREEEANRSGDSRE